MKRFFTILLTVSYFLVANAAPNAEALKTKELKLKAQLAKIEKVNLQLTEQNQPALKSIVNDQKFMTKTDGTWGRKIFTYNDQGQVTDYKYFFVDPFYDDSEEVFKEHQLYTYDNNGNNTSFELKYFDDWEGWKVVEKEEHTYNSQNKVTSSVFWDYDNFESENPYQKETYEYNDKTTRAEMYYWSEETNGWEHEGFADYLFDNNDRLAKAENHAYNEETGILELAFITLMTYNSAGELTRVANQFYDEIEEKFVDFIVSEIVYNTAGDITEETTTMSHGGMTLTMDKELYYYSNGKLVKQEFYMPNYDTFELYLFDFTEYEYQNGVLASETYFTIDYSSSSGFVATQKYEFEFDTKYSASDLVMPDIYMYDNYVADDIVDASYSEYGMLTKVNVFTIDYDTQELMPAKTANYHYSSGGTSNLSSDASLSGIFVDGDLIEGFNSNIFAYQIELPYNFSGVPQVTANATHNNAEVNITNAENIPGETLINVMAEDGETAYAYTVEFTLAAAPGSDASLSGIFTNNIKIDGFHSNDFEYTLILPAGTQSIPVVTASSTDTNASVVIDQATELPGSAIINVTAADGETVLIYYVYFYLNEELSNDASLSGIYIDGVLIDNFNNETNTYELELQSPVSVIPEITAVANDAGATVVVTPTFEVPGTVLILVVAADGTTSLLFTINISVVNGIDEINQSLINIYPNPCADQLNVQLKNQTNLVGASIYQINGKVEQHIGKGFNSERFVVNTNNLKPGLYYLNLQFDNGEVTMIKFVKQ